MIEINLLPWRAQKKAMAKKLVLFQTILAMVVSLFFSLLFHYFFLYCIAIENKKIIRAQSRLTQLTSQAASVKKIRESHFMLKLLTQLEERQKELIRLFNEMTLPISSVLYLTEMSYQGNKIQLSGMTSAVNSVNSFMDRLPQFQLKDIKTISPSQIHFQLQRMQHAQSVIMDHSSSF